ncbi:AAA family ATPase [Solirubrobacter ginsenosidimutans]|uniref:AAA family ATPase n=1 Tax=Solirubrobacter ginsenosidimutans TaxID=490573 RepID=A0A9X3MRC1_9ACTN|nr:LuxR family transcriptional regulator [Solirubrobacter ginsenosidimutans]MDA0160372.1 AAA family ATPase [Solirubrobacter ginsenosidimutans]
MITLRGRGDERERLDRLLQGVRTSTSAVLVLRGEAGIGKTALLEYVAEQASECRLARAAGVQSEMELAFAGLHHLCAPLLDGLDRLPVPQREALQTAFGVHEGGPPNRFLVAVAVLSLLAETAETRPLVCLIDDAQWLDRASAQVLAFVARRLLAEPIAMVFAVREPTDTDALAGLPELTVEGLTDVDARSLLAAVAPGRLDEQVRERIITETRGNPLALQELPRRLTSAQLAGGFGLPDARPLASRIEQSFLERVHALPRDTQRLLLTAAAEPVGDANLLWRAASRLGIATEAGRPAEAAGLFELGTRVEFVHPLIRSAVYRGASPSDRRDAHQALAEATDPTIDPDRRAWHRAHATAGPDEDVAAEMLRSADRAQRRGGLAAAAAFLQHATDLTPDPARRGERALLAAQAKLDVGDPATAAELLRAAELAPLDALQGARLARLNAQVVFRVRRGRDAPPLLLDAARRLTGLDATLARDTYLDALTAAMFAGRLAAGPSVGEVADAAGWAPRGEEPPRAADLLLDALVTRFTRGYAAAVTSLSAALRACAERDETRWLSVGCRLAQDLWDDELWGALATGGERVARDTGALSLLPVALTYRAALDVHAGRFAAAEALIEETDAIGQVSESAPVKYASLMLAAWRGDHARAIELFEPARREGTARGEGMGLGVLDWATALLHNGGGHHREALEAAQRACEHDDVGTYAWALAELIEAAVREGRPDEAAAALARLSERTRASGTDWALGIEAGSRALVHDDEAAYRESVERLAGTRMALQLARSRLLYGEWLRRENRRVDARELLRAAHGAFSDIGAEAFAERARRELQATGETARRRDADTRDVLTPQEAQVARLARDGHTNPEIGAQLFISPRTVEYHLRKVFRKLDVATRRDLRQALAC